MKISVGDDVAGIYQGHPYTAHVEDVKDDGQVLLRFHESIPGVAKGGAVLLDPETEDLVALEQLQVNDTDDDEAPIADLVEEYHEAQQVVSAIAAYHKTAKEKADGLRHLILERMDAERLQQVRVKLHDGSATMAYRSVTARPTAKDREAVVAWCEGLGVDPAMFLAWNAAKFGSWWKERNEEGLSLPPGVEVYHQEDVRFRKA